MAFILVSLTDLAPASSFLIFNRILGVTLNLGPSGAIAPLILTASLVCLLNTPSPQFWGAVHPRGGRNGGGGQLLGCKQRPKIQISHQISPSQLQETFKDPPQILIHPLSNSDHLLNSKLLTN